MATLRFAMNVPQFARPEWASFGSSLRLGLILSAVYAAAFIGCSGSPSETPSPIRKIVLISLDTLRPDHLGVYGYPRETSPRIDEFARQSFVFDRMLAPAPNTPPSQMAMMTSLYPGRHGFTGKGDRLSPGIATLAERLREQMERSVVHLDRGEVKFTASFGVAQMGAGCESLEALVAAADSALYEAKERGRNRVFVATPPVGEDATL